MSLADYLAKKYLTADPAPDKKSKKRKRKGTAATADVSGLTIADDDLTGWKSTVDANGQNDDEDGPLLVGNIRASESRKSKKSSWKTIGAAAPSNAEQAAADAILASAAAERDAQEAANRAEDAPQVVKDEDGEEDEPAVAGTGMTGLQSGAQVAKAMKKKADAERAQFDNLESNATGKGQETIYRDASGRIVNVAMKRAEARKKADEEAAKQRALEEATKGDVQRLQKEQRKQKLEDAKYMTVARYADDTEMNEEMKERDRWNDPAAGFVVTKKKGKSVTGKPLYKGAAPPNRYGIRPGYRWDGVDRSNGFEKEYFAARNRRKNQKEMEYAWEMDA